MCQKSNIKTENKGLSQRPKAGKIDNAALHCLNSNVYNVDSNVGKTLHLFSKE